MKWSSFILKGRRNRKLVNLRVKRAKLNIFVSLISQFVALVCGLIVPRLLIDKFGSEAYGATTSITQFLAYITLLEAGIGGVARAALYKPLAHNDTYHISAVVHEIKRFFRMIGYAFFIYVIVLACAYKQISHIQCFDWISTALLVVVISISTFAQYFIGISYSVLLQAAQRTYITKIISMCTTVLNTFLVIILVSLDCDLITVKFLSSLVFSIKPFAMWLYVRKEFKLIQIKEINPRLLEQKWSGLGQHIAYFLHSNTDVAVLTILVNLSTVAVYSVYNMVVTEIQNITSSFSTGMEAVFGDMLAKKEDDLLSRTFSYYETLISVIAIFLFSVTAVMIVPFVKLYTAKITDINYIQPLFALLIVIAALLYCLRMPYHSMIIAAGHFRQTQIAAYGEAIINILLSISLVIKLGLVGVAIGTVVAVLFRFCFYAFYLSKHIFGRKIEEFYKRGIINFCSFIFVYYTGSTITNIVNITNYFMWVICACVISFVAIVVLLITTNIFYKEDLKPVANIIFRRNESAQ